MVRNFRAPTTSPKDSKRPSVNSCSTKTKTKILTTSERTTSRRNSRTEDTSDKSKNLSRRLIDLSGRVGRKVRTFVSRPIREPVMKRFVTRVETRKSLKMPSTNEGQLIHGEVSFPRLQRRTFTDKRLKVSNEVFTDTPQADQNLPATSVAEGIMNKELVSICKLVYGNNDNGGKVIINDRPFWMEEDQEEYEDSDTADDLQLNAEIVLEVDEGKIKLESMPRIPITLDPFNEMSILKARDGLFYTKGILFGNSVRSMINLSDMTSVRVRSNKKRRRIVAFELPTAAHQYTREKWYRLRKFKYTSLTEDVPHGSKLPKKVSKKKSLGTLKNPRRDKSSQKKSKRINAEDKGKVGGDEAY